MSDALLIVSSSPHIRSKSTTQSLMRDVLIALIPALIASIIIFGWRCALVVAVCVVTCMASEYISRRLMKKSNTLSDLSCIVTGVLLAFNMPVTIPLWMAMIGCIVAIVVVKQLFGGLGQNIANPALVARIVLMVSFPAAMTNFVAPLYGASTPDFIATATPLALGSGSDSPALLNMFFGLRAGCLGETCVLALLIGGIYLIIRRVISPIIPLCYLGTVAVCYLLAGADPLYYLMSGGLMLGAFFMATDYVTSPLTWKGKIIFAVGCGLLTYIIRTYCYLPEGVSYAIVLMNLLVPLIERGTRTKVFGVEKHV